MKTLLLFLVLLLASTANAQVLDLNGQWEHGGEPDLAGFKIHWGTVSGNYTHNIDIPLAHYVGPDSWTPLPTGWLMPGTLYMAATAYDLTGNESGYSEEVPVTIPDGPPGTGTGLRLRYTAPDGTEIIFEIIPP